MNDHVKCESRAEKIMRSADFTMPQKLILMSLVIDMDNDDICYDTLENLAKKSSLSKNNLVTNLNKLSNLDYFTFTRHTKNSNDITYSFQLNINKFP